MDISLKDRFRGSIVGGAVGDALGAPLEFMTTPESLRNAAPDGPKMPTPSFYTDDTQMSMCVAHALIGSKGDIDRFMDGLCDLFVDWYDKQYEGGPECRGPGNSCLAACKNLKAGMPWPEAGVHSLGCGSAMRSGPIGLYHYANMLKVIEWGRDSSIPTHTHEAAVASSVAAALMVYYAVKEVPVGIWPHELSLPLSGVSGGLMDLLQKATQAVADNVDPCIALSNQCLGEGWLGHEAVASALYCCLRHPDDFRGAVETAAYTVGDSDSIAAITGAIMGARLGLGAIPKEWVDVVENRDMLIDTADRLYAASCTMSV